MNKLKWICRYAFLSLLLAGGIGWTVYCHITVVQLEKLAGSLEFIDLALHHAKDAVEVLARIDRFTSLRSTGIVICVVLALCLAALVLYHIYSPKLLAALKERPKKERPKKERPKKERKPKQKKISPTTPAPVPNAPVAPAPITVPVEEPPVVGEPAVETPEEAPMAETLAEAPPVPVVFCPECGTRHEGTPAFCFNCGRQFPN